MCDWLEGLASFGEKPQIPCRPACGAPVPATHHAASAPAPAAVATIGTSTLIAELERRAALVDATPDDASRPRDRLALLAELSQNLPAGAPPASSPAGPPASSTKPRAAEAEDIKKMRNDRREKRIYRSKSLSPPRRAMADAADDNAAVSAARDGKPMPAPRKRQADLAAPRTIADAADDYAAVSAARDGEPMPAPRKRTADPSAPRTIADAADDYAAVSAAARDGKYTHPAHPPPPRKRSHHEAGEAPPRGGKWTEAEERYAALIVARFSDGTFPGLRGGESLRNLLADLLQCTGMRVTKKYSRTRLLRKTAFVRAGELGADGVEALESARAAFLADEPYYCPASRAARDAEVSGAAAPTPAPADPAPPDDAGARRRGRGRGARTRTRRRARTAPRRRARTRRGAGRGRRRAGADAAPARGRAPGKWTKPEEHYAALVIDHFATGKLPGLTGGESLRLVLSDLLRCTRMRVTKKLSQTKILRKSCFWPLGELTAEEHAELDAARDQFIAAEPHYRRARAPLDGAREPPAPEPAAKPPAPPATVSPESPDPIAPAAPAPVHSGD
ncbi:DNA binding protein [Aureococcus anophagefferens]|uniref:DNA binding protein n=1 Tax=Aureococcus anophagefferens TaxID=44056 RepID=A0ABR1FGZ6_AURAN